MLVDSEGESLFTGRGVDHESSTSAGQFGYTVPEQVADSGRHMADEDAR